MRGERFGDPLDAELDGEIRALLAVDPSPQFRASVRMRIANEPAAVNRRRLWWLGAAATAAAAVMAFKVVAPSRPLLLTSTLTARSSVHLALPESPRARRLASGVVSSDVVSPSRRTSLTRPGGTPPSEPEILLAPDETRALRALIAGVREGRIDLTPASQATTPDVMELEPIRKLVIPPIVITPVEGVQP
ncbi:MAG TPA: hypothetical protein VG222_01025 [Vicinamibacterales bacterium]|jgi:hypothetical protein|nr:hypothetical protein [Vicinamibacterales bacterium]